MDRIYWDGWRFRDYKTDKEVTVEPLGNPIILSYLNPHFDVRNLEAVLGNMTVDKDLDFEKRELNNQIGKFNAFSVSTQTLRQSNTTVYTIAFQYFEKK